MWNYTIEEIVQNNSQHDRTLRSTHTQTTKLATRNLTFRRIFTQCIKSKNTRYEIDYFTKKILIKD